VTRFLIDSDCAIYVLTGQHSALGERLSLCEPGDVAISSVSFAELALGSRCGHPPSPALLNDFAALVPVLSFDEAAARAYAGLPFRRARFDRLLAAHALSLGMTIITNDEADFADIPGLKVENWTLPL
jgi:tRNA(fMet)-specific endonuclease VapC